MSFDAGSIEARLVLNRSEFTAGLAAAQTEASKGVKVPVLFDISQQSVARAVAASKSLFTSSPVTVPVIFGISQASVTKAIAASKALFTAKPVTVPVTFSVSQAARSEERRVGKECRSTKS